MRLYLAWILSLFGLFFSLYFSEWKNLEPCHFCWWQRIALFPLAVQLGIATYTTDWRGALLYGLPLALFGLIMGVTQLSLPELGFSCGCATVKDPLVLGLIPLPWVSTMGFALIALVLCIKRRAI